MTVSLHSFVGMYRRDLTTLAHILAKGVAFAESRGETGSDMLGWRLADDMNPMAFQFAVAINFINGWTARMAGEPVPDAIVGADLDVAGFESAIAQSSAFLDSITADQVAGRDDVAITFKIGEIMEPTLPAEQWITGFATTNIHFHLSMAYAILRMKGAPLGKIDLFPRGL
jgi:uncharacterized protein